MWNLEVDRPTFYWAIEGGEWSADPVQSVIISENRIVFDYPRSDLWEASDNVTEMNLEPDGYYHYRGGPSGEQYRAVRADTALETSGSLLESVRQR